MGLKQFARVVGVILLLVGILGFFFENLFGLFHLGTVHSIVHAAFGIWGILASGQLASSKLFARVIGIVYLLIGIFGFFTMNLFGIMDVGLSDNLLHLIVGALGLYAGYVASQSG